MMTRFFSAAIGASALMSAAIAAPQPQPEPIKADQFLARCKTDWDFCRARIVAQITELNAVREACVPNDVKRDEAAVRVAYVLEEAIEEAPDLFEYGDYKGFVAQVIALIWPCGVVS